MLPLLFFVKGNAQYYYQLYYNLELQAQVTANQAVRVASEKLYQNSYEKQRKSYDDIKEKVTQVVVIKNHIYNQLRNVNSALKRGNSWKLSIMIFQNYWVIWERCSSCPRKSPSILF